MADFEQLETRRLELEENVAKLRKSLQHWRTWDAEYEGLKEELSSGINVQSEKDCVQKIEDQLSKVLDEMDKEDDDTLGPGLPITEILEELDEDGNIISSKVTQPEQQTAQIVETLRKAGLKDIDPKSKDGVTTKPSEPETTGNPTAALANKTQDTPKAAADSPKAAKKGLSFAEEVQEREIPSRTDNASASKSGVNPSLFSGTFAKGERVIELDDDDDIIGTQAVIPEDESPEDARLRREMLQYNLNEVGQVVAELDLDENLSEFEDDDDYFDDDYDSELSEEEDEHGRSIRPGVSKSYRDQMRELDKQ
ncbi:hypothetical protein E4T44_13758, partial [Aureobasidium sp. EXF-8845]